MKRAKEFTSLLLAILLIFSTVSFTGTIAFGAGSNNLIEIKTVNDLISINNNLSANYILMNDIDLSGISNWTPIGDSQRYAEATKDGSYFYENDNDEYFSGTFDGNGFSIKSLSFDKDTNAINNSKPSVESFGLFAHISNASIKNLSFENVKVNINVSNEGEYKYRNKVVYGTIAATATNSTIENCIIKNGYSSGLKQNAIFGGIVGVASYNCTFNNIFVNLNKLAGVAGGIVGEAYSKSGSYSNPSKYNIIRNCINYGDIAGAGIAYYMDGYIQNCYNYGKVESSGIVYYSNHFLDITNCTNYGEINATVSSTRKVGSILSHYPGNISGSISNCYNYGNINVKSIAKETKYMGCLVGGILGDNYTKIKINSCANYGNITVDLSQSCSASEIAGVAVYATTEGTIENYGDIKIINPHYRVSVAGTILMAENIGEYSCLKNYGDISVVNADMPKTTSGYCSIGGALGSLSDIKDTCELSLCNEGNIEVSGDLTYYSAGGLIQLCDSDLDDNICILNNLYNTGNISIRDTTATSEDTANIGGLIGICMSEKPSLNNVYNMGSIKITRENISSSENINTGIFWGCAPKISSADITNCYYGSNSVGCRRGKGDNGILDKLKKISDFSNTASFSGFDFDDYWSLKNGAYPELIQKVEDVTKPLILGMGSNNTDDKQEINYYIADNTKKLTYYFGSKQSPSNSDYVELKPTEKGLFTLKKAAKLPGTYYMIVHDNDNRNIFNVVTIKTTLEAGVGTVSPTSVLTIKGRSFLLPIPTRKGYEYSGWSSSSSATNGVTTLKPTTNATYYAVWKGNQPEFTQSNRFKFSNSQSNFVTSWSGGNYYMTQSDYNKLVSYIKKYDNSSSSTISSVQELMYSSWGGSCYGMAAAAVLDYQNKIGFNENFDNGAKTLWDVKSPSTDKNIMSAINYYMVSQKIGYIRNSSSYYNRDYYPSSWTPGLKKLVSTAQKGEPFLFCYYTYSFGHAIVALNCKTNSDGSFSITAYDNRYPYRDVIIKVNSSYTSCIVNGNENAVGFEIYNDMSAFDKIDIDGPNNDMKISYNSYSYNQTTDEVSIVASSNITVTNANGETISIIDGKFQSNMDILSVHRIVRDTADGTPAAAEFVFEVDHSKSYYFESDNDNMDVSVKTNKIYGSVSSKNADCIAIGDDGVYVIGNNMEYSTALSSKDNVYNTVILEGAANCDVSLSYSGNNIIINGINGKDESIKIFEHDEMNPKVYEIKEGFREVKVVAEDSKIDIKGSSKNNENFDVSVLKSNGVESVSIGDIELNYKKSTTLKPQINADEGVKYTVKYSSSNAKVATVDDNGKVTATKRGSGSSTITCTVTDEFGNTVTDTCKVNVKLSLSQLLIVIILFGWIWY